ncbi:MAG: nucleotide-binding universal stress UspA family protein [Paraglaciecola sp.]|jgi:nucleotide-binding universal stress UspA family protein
MMKKIMTCVDGSAMTAAVTDAAIWASKKLDKPMCFLHTLEKEQQHGADDYSGAIGLGARTALLEEMTKLDEQRGKVALQLGKELLSTAAKKAENAGVKSVEMIQRHGDVVEAINDLQDKIRLIVIGRSGQGHDDNFKSLGSHIETLLRKASDPVLIVPAEFKQPASFMVAYDGRETADNALQKVIDGGLLYGLHCHLVSVKNNETHLNDKLDAAKKRLENEGFTVTASFIEGDIHQSLMAYKTTNNVDLVVMGAFAHSKLRQLFVGSNTIKMLEHCDVPLIVLR